jgi:hypothetical protein
MHDDAASRKSVNDDALGQKGRCTFSHKLCVKNEAGSPKRGEAPLSKKDASQGSGNGKLLVNNVAPLLNVVNNKLLRYLSAYNHTYIYHFLLLVTFDRVCKI